ncbi:hypothetical protein [Nakamurella sp. PAMC28650]|uniref:hypothetical protein n=1 Tax=Nakamurella sp. PAMC28650 TaxID=2762325 RepID=UPI00164CF1F6|nr:hypothetical protein [Nakamurella sp. PAMC28650]QNK83237.1 hypothetical protein H7F38_11675 [Nakamurella sp. PAMC28650]
MEPAPSVPIGFVARTEQTLEPTPSVGGYLTGAAVTVVLGSVLIAAIVFMATENIFSVSGFLAVTGIVGMVAALAALILGFPLIVLAHFRLRGVRPQWIHVAVFAGIGAVVGLLAVAVVLNGYYTAGVSASMVTVVAFAAAVGRWCVSARRWREPFPFDR